MVEEIVRIEAGKSCLLLNRRRIVYPAIAICHPRQERSAIFPLEPTRCDSPIRQERTLTTRTLLNILAAMVTTR